jgi:ribonuclease BN (tRNA processing enzyme)
VLFITDSFYVKDKFKNIHNVLIEANYCQTIIDKKVKDGASPEFLRNRIFKSHMSLATCKQTLLANDLSKVRNIVLIHLSDSNSDAARFKTEIENITGKQVFIADAGMTIENFSKTAF